MLRKGIFPCVNISVLAWSSTLLFSMVFGFLFNFIIISLTQMKVCWSNVFFNLFTRQNVGARKMWHLKYFPVPNAPNHHQTRNFSRPVKGAIHYLDKILANYAKNRSEKLQKNKSKTATLKKLLKCPVQRSAQDSLSA